MALYHVYVGGYAGGEDKLYLVRADSVSQCPEGLCFFIDEDKKKDQKFKLIAMFKYWTHWYIDGCVKACDLENKENNICSIQ